MNGSTPAFFEDSQQPRECSPLKKEVLAIPEKEADLLILESRFAGLKDENGLTVRTTAPHDALRINLLQKILSSTIDSNLPPTQKGVNSTSPMMLGSGTDYDHGILSVLATVIGQPLQMGMPLRIISSVSK